MSYYAERKIIGGGASDFLRHARALEHFYRNPGASHELSLTPEFRSMLQDYAERAAEEARGVAPVATGAYQASIHGEVERSAEHGWVGVVKASDWKSSWIEFGTVKQAPMSPLRRGAEAAGLKVRKPGREGT